MAKKEEYTKKELRQHIYDTPDTYAGGSDLITETLPIVLEDGSISFKEIEYIPVLYNIFNEILVNARDQIIRLEGVKDAAQVSHIKVTYDTETGEWSILNDGQGISIEKHSSENIYNPELIFGRLLTSSNYDKDEKKIVGGKNGYGAKLTNIFSTFFKVETVDHINELKYTQEFHNNMTVIDKPKIAKSKKKPYTHITWKTDFNRFGISSFSEDMVSFMVRRIYDVAGITDKRVSVFYNGTKLKIKSFQDYINLYPSPTTKTYEKISDRWELIVCPSSNDKFEQVSFVNGIATPKGGVHVDCIVKQIMTAVVAYIKKKHKREIPEKYVKNYLSIYLNCVIENPSFDSQTKERLITPKSKFGSKPEISDKFIKKVCDSGLSEKVLQFSDFKDNTTVKKTNGTKKNKLRDIPKLDDANNAGTRKSHLCTLILTEGDSAKSMAVAGLSVVGRDNYGVFPLRGKLLNTRDTAIKQIANNQEITNIKKILGLESGKEYKDLKQLRYGKVMIMTDQDHDGYHIKGLLLNMIHDQWPELLQHNFINCMVTPIIKATKGKVVKSFYSMTDYNHWKNTNDAKKWHIKYYKGLGTSTALEAKEYFKNLKINQYTTDENTDKSINLAFKKTEADQRKEWLKTYDEDDIIDYNQENISIDTFIHKEFKHFSNSDNKRSIGCAIDGLKVSQRKILFSCFKRKLYSEIRVAQLSGYVSEQAAYHHGEVSLQGAIIGMAQTFVGANNINLLEPNGQFGTRIMGGSDAASARYIHTELNPIVDKIFPSKDFPLLDYIDDDGLIVEPKWYCPIIPMVLVNGMIGIGTGFSTTIPQYNPLDCIRNIMRKLRGEPYMSMNPYYRGFTGTIEKFQDSKTKLTKFITKGKYTIDDDKVTITELPIGKWTSDFKEFIEKEIQKENPWILDYENHSTDDTVKFVVKINDEVVFDNTYKKNDVIEEKFKLTSSKSVSNLHLYDKNGVIRKYDTIYQIMDDHFHVRLTMYEERKVYELDILRNDMWLLNEKMRFIQDVINDKIIIYKQRKDVIVSDLRKGQYAFYEDSKMREYDESEEITTQYNYLLMLTINQFTQDKIDELQKMIDKKSGEYNVLENTDIKDIWLEELNELKLECKRM